MQGALPRGDLREPPQEYTEVRAIRSQRRNKEGLLPSFADGSMLGDKLPPIIPRKPAQRQALEAGDRQQGKVCGHESDTQKQWWNELPHEEPASDSAASSSRSSDLAEVMDLDWSEMELWTSSSGSTSSGASTSSTPKTRTLLLSEATPDIGGAGR